MLVESWMKKCMGAQWDRSLNAMKCDEERERENGITARSSESLDVPLAVT